MDQLTGIAAILRFPMPELEESDAEDDSDAESEWYLFCLLFSKKQCVFVIDYSHIIAYAVCTLFVLLL